MRAIFRLLTMGLAMILIAYTCFALQWIVKPFPKAHLRFVGFFFKWTTKVMLFFMQVKVHVQGVVPRKPFFMVSNHLSYVDILVLASVTGATFVAKKEVRSWPVVGRIARIYQTIFLNRESKQDIARVFTVVADHMKKGCGVILFPEGTSSDGQQVLPFYSSLFKWPAEHLYPVHMVSLHYRSNDAMHPAEQSVCWWGDMTFGAHFKGLLSLKKVDAYLSFTKETVLHADRKVLAKLAYEKVNEHFKRSV